MKNSRIISSIIFSLLSLMTSCVPLTSTQEAGPTKTPLPESIDKPTAAPTESELRAVLEIPPSLPLGEAVILRFFLVNDTGNELYVLNWFTPLEGIGGEIFRVKRDGQLVPYQGILASRGDPGPESYTLLEPGGIAWAEADLAKSYDFSKPGRYTIEFISPRNSHVARSEAEINVTLNDLGPVEIPANEAAVKIIDENLSSAAYEAAQDTLIRYFTLLNEGKYAEAVEFYGGGYDLLMDWNPTADADDLAGLLERGCTVNGLRCLPVKTITPLETTDQDIFEFSIEFENPDGSLFVLNPEGDWPKGAFPQSLFVFKVVRTDDSFAVPDLPVYVP